MKKITKPLPSPSVDQHTALNNQYGTNIWRKPDLIVCCVPCTQQNSGGEEKNESESENE
jgi:hypothetical protein